VEVIANGTNDQNQLNQTELAAGTELEGNLDAETILGISWPDGLHDRRLASFLAG
jgi:tripeptidyl-peptidase-1